MRRFAVLADDATGANASAGALAWGLHRAVSVWDDLPPSAPYPLVLNTRSREDSGRSHLVSDWGRVLWNQGVRDFDKRIDTTLRGPAAEELKRLCLALPDVPWIGVVSAYPEADRTTKEGRQWITGQAVHEVLSVQTSHLGEYLFGSPHDVFVISREQYLDQHLSERLLEIQKPIVFDVQTEIDLVHVSRILHKVRKRHAGSMVTVTSGAVLRYYPAVSPRRTAIIVGSPTTRNVQQVHYLLRHSNARVGSLGQSLDRMATLPDVIVLHSGLHVVKIGGREAWSRQLAHNAVARLEELSMQGWTPDRLVLTGGEMAQAFLDCTGAVGTRIVAMPEPLVSHGYILAGSYADTEILTKGGMVGDESLFFELASLPALPKIEDEVIE